MSYVADKLIGTKWLDAAVFNLCYVWYRADRHGQVSREMAEPYYLYGRALLEVAREKSAVFGGGVPGGGVPGESGGESGGIRTFIAL